ncbi:MAG: hypothetical protein ACYC0V_21530 [Armatimonadota bacterium]
MSFAARFDSKCCVCGNKIRRGDMISLDGRDAWHEDCVRATPNTQFVVYKRPTGEDNNWVPEFIMFSSREESGEDYTEVARYDSYLDAQDAVKNMLSEAGWIYGGCSWMHPESSDLQRILRKQGLTIDQYRFHNSVDAAIITPEQVVWLFGQGLCEAYREHIQNYTYTTGSRPSRGTTSKFLIERGYTGEVTY